MQSKIRTPQVPWGLDLLRSIDVMVSHLREDDPLKDTTRFAESLFLTKEEATQINECAPFLLREVLVDGGKAVDFSILKSKGDRIKIGPLKSSSPHVIFYMRGWLEVLFDFDQKVPLIIKPVEFEKTWILLNSWLEDQFVPFAKYTLTYPMAKFLKNPVPEKPTGFIGGAIIFTGALKRFLKARIVSYTQINARLMQCILQGIKRATKVVPQSYVYKSLEKHRVALTKDYKFNASNVFEFSHLADWVCSSFSTKPKLFEASVSASYENSRSRGGQRDFVMTSISDVSVDRSSLLEPILIKMNEVSTSTVSEERRMGAPPTMSDVQFLLKTHDAQDEFGNSFEIEEQTERLLLRKGTGRWDDHPVGYKSRLLTEPLDTTGNDLPSNYLWYEMEGLESRESGRLLKAKVSPVREPLKVRLITKGESLPYWYSKFFQKDMWGFLKGLPQFRLVGESVSIEILDELRSRSLKPGSPVWEYWVSGDYSAATDNIKSVYSKAAFESFLNHSELSFVDKEILRSVLYEHELSYPKVPGHVDLDPATQKTGQLMGSPMSFPILCLVNFVAYLMSMRRYLGEKAFEKWRLHEFPVLVNGDDILFPSNPVHYQIWLSCIREVGFELSLGKNYQSARFLTVNSELFESVNGSFVHIPYLNAGLLTGQSKLNSDREKIQNKPIWAIQKIVNNGALSKLRTYQRFVHYNLDQINTVTNHGEYNLFIHPMLGGLGFVKPEGLTIEFTAWQEKVALYLREFLTQPVEGKTIRTTHFWKGIVVKSSRLTEKPTEKYRRVIAIKGDGPLNKGERIFEEPSALEGMLTGFYDTEKPNWEIKMLPVSIVRGVRERYPKPLKVRPKEINLLEFPFRFVEIQRHPLVIQEQILGYKERTFPTESFNLSEYSDHGSDLTSGWKDLPGGF